MSKEEFPKINRVWNQAGTEYKDYVPKKVQEVADEMAEALTSISKNSCCDTCQEAKLVATKALQSYNKLKESE